jgi:hypothetical protein
MLVRPLRIFAASCAAALSVSLPAFAAETGSGSAAGSGAALPPAPLTAEEKLSALEALLEKRTVRSREDAAGRAEALAAFLKDTRAYEQELALKRDQCNTAIRRANRDTKLAVTESCFRSDLLLQMSFLRREASYLKQLMGLREDRRALALAANKNLSDAMATIIDAIDSGVYERPENLSAAKRKLWQQYSRQRYLTLGLVRADRTLAWIGLLGQRISQLLQDGAPNEAAIAKLHDSVDCLHKMSSIVSSFEALTEYESTKVPFGQYQSGLKKCVESLRAAVRLQKGFPAEPEEGPSVEPEAGSGTTNISTE